MPRKRTGAVEPFTTADGKLRFRARILLEDGTRHREPVPEGHSKARARDYTAYLQEREDQDGAIYKAKQERLRRIAEDVGTEAPGETSDAWHKRFCDSREGKIADMGTARARWRKWISPHIGPTPIAEVTRKDIEAVRNAIDAAIEEDLIAPKTGQNIWSELTNAFRHAVNSKRPDLQVRESNPCEGVIPPEDGAARRKPWFYPREVTQLLGCEKIPLDCRELYAVAAFLYLRPGELYELRFCDIDLAANMVSITRAWEWSSRTVGPPKTRNGIRDIQIPVNLRPLLERMAKGKRPDQKVVPAIERTGKHRTAALLREHLALAGVDHARLSRDDATHMAANFRTFRDSGITWLALEGVDSMKMLRRAGHDEISTTMGYVKAAEDHSQGAIGVPFPPLPESLICGTLECASGSGSADLGGIGCNGSMDHASEFPHNLAESDVSRRLRFPAPPQLNQQVPQLVAHSVALSSPPEGSSDAVVTALLRALEVASAQGNCDAIIAVTEELKARRLERAGVVPIGSKAKRQT